jgi:hypothetical protein
MTSLTGAGSMLRKLVPLVLLATLAVPFVACKTSQVGVKNTFGTYNTLLSASPEEVTEAAAEVAQDLKLANVQVTSTSVDGRVEAHTAAETKVTIRSKLAGDGVTEIKIRVGAGFGDEMLSLDILDRIKAKLKD